MLRSRISTKFVPTCGKNIIPNKKSFVSLSRTLVFKNVQTRNYAIRELLMPALTPTMDKGNIKKWTAKVGDKLTPGDVFCQIETDKALNDFDATEDLYLAKILVGDGTDDVEVHRVIALVADEESEISQADSFKPKEATKKQESPKQEQAEQPKSQPKQPEAEEEYEEYEEEEEVASSAASSSLPKGAKEIQMPSLSPTMEAGNLIEWTVKEGQEVKAGDVVALVQTDKAKLDFEYPDDGYIGKILVPGGTDDVKLGTPIAILVQSPDDVAALKDYKGGEATSAPQKKIVKKRRLKQKTGSESSTPVREDVNQGSKGGRVLASPIAKKIAQEKNINLEQVTGTGPNGRIIKADVEEYKPSAKQATQTQSQPSQSTTTEPKSQKTSAPVAADVSEGNYKDIPASAMRKVIAKRLTESKRDIPHYYVTVECELDQLMKVRAQLNKAGEKRGYKLSVNDFLIKAAALSMKKVPAVNSSWRGEFIREYHNVDVSVAVSTDNGLITPIVTDAEKRGLSDISHQVKQLADKAKQGKLQSHEFQGGTFTISNLGMFGVHEFSAIINPPQACILAVGGAESKVVVNDKHDANDPSSDKYKVVTVMKVTLSSDHRVVDGAAAAQWLQEFKTHIENPLYLML
ncbi:pyruvate dehydrogenase [Acrasis kona]|uniref:Acetyltransferase component of pyruvate dehydrogenase complex n=1 Tax=Acrasis kona TaxID=1008807 RepID=A0AAW2ZJ82_9EUKA